MSLVTTENLVKFLNDNKGYLKCSPSRIYSAFCSKHNACVYNEGTVQHNKYVDIVKQALDNMKQAEKQIVPFNEFVSSNIFNNFQVDPLEYGAFLEWKKSQMKEEAPMIKSRVSHLKPYKGNPDNVLIIGDLHCPFDLDDYLEFCYNQQVKFDCGTVVFIGDIVEAAAWNMHEKATDALSQKEEISTARKRLADWYYVFPEATVTLGNHDLLIARQMKKAGLSLEFMQDFGVIWNAPKTWNFVYEIIINGVRYTHGDKSSAMQVAKDSRTSTVQGHRHTEGYVEYSVSDKDRIFGLQVGCGIDHKHLAFEYAKSYSKKPFIGCGVILDKGQLPIIVPMHLENKKENL